MLVSLSIAIALQGPEVHPAFLKKPVQFEDAWKAGEKEGAGSRPNALKLLDKFKRGIGSVRTGPLVSETVSFLWYAAPEALCYFTACNAKFNMVATDKVEEQKKDLMIGENKVQRELIFLGQISLFPSFGGPYGRLDRNADPSHLKDVRVVMKIGDKIFEPREQPGELLQASGTGQNSISFPQYSYETTNSTATATAYGTGGTATAYGTGRSETMRTYYVRERQGWNWYQGFFTATFDIFDQDGSPRIGPKDKEVSVTVIYGPNKREVKYKLTDMANPKL